MTALLTSPLRSISAHQEIAYVSGPMSGIPDFNRPAFEAAREYLEARDFIVIVPGDGEEYSVTEVAEWKASSANRAIWMKRDFLSIIDVATCVVALEGWWESPGARAEVLVAQTIGLPVFLFDDGLWPERVQVTTRVNC